MWCKCAKVSGHVTWLNLATKRVRRASAGGYAETPISGLHVAIRDHSEGELECERLDPLKSTCTQLKATGFITTRHKMPGSKGTRHSNPEIPVPGMRGRGILGLG